VYPAAKCKTGLNKSLASNRVPATRIF
jgi:hypothetical protein